MNGPRNGKPNATPDPRQARKVAEIAVTAHSKQGLGRTLLVQDPAADQQAEGHEHHGLA
jgi:hypothetical protein